MTVIVTPPVSRPAQGASHRIRRAFDRAAKGYGKEARVVAAVGESLFRRLADVRDFSPRRVLDLGSGPGALTRKLMQAYPKAQVVGVDLSWEMVRLARGRRGFFRRKAPHFLEAAMERLPFPNHTFDLVVSNLALHWSPDLPGAFRQIRRVLAPGGLLFFTVIGDHNLWQWREAWMEAGGDPFFTGPTLHALGDLMLGAGLSMTVLDREEAVLRYDDSWALLRELRRNGVTNPLAPTQAGLAGRQRIAQAARIHGARFPHQSGGVAISVEVFFGHALRGAEGKPRAMPPLGVGP